MDEESIGTDNIEPCWFIDLDWYQQNNRSFLTLAQRCLCSKCGERLEGEEISAADLLSTIKDCCSKARGFITRNLPVSESIFRLFLANGNQPLNLEELGKQLGEWRGGDASRTSAEVLTRLLQSDQHYGFGQAKD
jgi:hypothetical protein